MAEKSLLIRVVVDTNIWIGALSSKSKNHWVVKAFLAEKFELIVSNDILAEYEEKLKEKYSPQVAADFLDALDFAVNVVKATPFYYWNLIQDADDNKFSDCAISAGADYLITEDKDFNALKQIDFPKVSVLSLAEFKKILSKLK